MLAADSFAARSSVPLLKSLRAFAGICSSRRETWPAAWSGRGGGVAPGGNCATHQSGDNKRAGKHDVITRNQLLRARLQVGPNFSPDRNLIIVEKICERCKCNFAFFFRSGKWHTGIVEADGNNSKPGKAVAI